MTKIIDDIPFFTDKYFSNTKAIIEKYGDKKVTYAVFMRRPILFAPQIAVTWLQKVAAAKNIKIDVKTKYQEGDWIGSGEPMLYYSGSFAELVELETIFLQKIGATSVAAYNAFAMALELPQTAFIAMDARHCAGSEMADLMAYGAFVGTKAANKKGAKGFIGTANDATCHYFGLKNGLGTMPHNLIGYADSTLEAAKMFHDLFPQTNLVVLADFFGKEITDSLEVCSFFKKLADEGKVSIRLDTHGGRFVEGLNTNSSYNILEKKAPEAIKNYRTEQELKHLIGTGVSAAAIWYLREELNKNGFDKVKIVASSGFSLDKCHIMAVANAPLDVIGTGSYLPLEWTETYATADVICYDDRQCVKLGREFLLQ
ncbi:MAG: nicotinate phosphoribosyltransferase [Alphaproteobacteria bacterium]